MLKIDKGFEVILWSIAFPGFGQILNNRFLKGILFIVLEFMININAHINQAILLSFHGETLKAIAETNYDWLLFYPCIYIFSIWDAYHDALKDKEIEVFAFIPFVCSAFFGTIGVIYSSTLDIFGMIPGPIFLPLIFFVLGFSIGYFMKRKLIVKKSSNQL